MGHLTAPPAPLSRQVLGCTALLLLPEALGDLLSREVSREASGGLLHVDLGRVTPAPPGGWHHQEQAAHLADASRLRFLAARIQAGDRVRLEASAGHCSELLRLVDLLCQSPSSPVLVTVPAALPEVAELLHAAQFAPHLTLLVVGPRLADPRFDACTLRAQVVALGQAAWDQGGEAGLPRPGAAEAYVSVSAQLGPRWADRFWQRQLL